LMLQQLSFKWAVAVIYPGRLMIHDH
jgi:hypothetical protein